MKNKIFLMIFGIFFISFTSANLIISPNSLDFNTKINTQKTLTLTLTNNYSFTIYDIKFGNLTEYGFTYPNTNINSGQTKTIDITLNRETSFHSSIPITIEFKYNVDIPIEVTNYNVNITGNGFKPQYLTIRKGDSVTWKNIDDVTNTVTSLDFDYDIPINGTITHLFNSVGSFPYSSLTMYYYAEIDVINRTETAKAHNPNYDLNYIVNADVSVNPTTLEVTNFDEYFEIKATESDEGMIRIKNTGNDIAEVIKISSSPEWITFSENNFDMIKNSQKYINYYINPVIFETNETNKTYNMQIKIKASNTEEYTKTIQVFIPYMDVDTNPSDPAYVLRLIEEFCRRNPTNAFCNPNVNSSNGTVIYRDRDIPINLTEVDFYNLIKDINKIKDSLSRNDNKLKDIAEKYGISIPELINLVNMTFSNQVKFDSERKTWNDLYWIIGGGLLIILITGSLIKVISKKSYKESIISGQFDFR